MLLSGSLGDLIKAANTKGNQYNQIADAINLLKENVNKFATALCSDISNMEDIRKLDALLKNYNIIYS